MKGVGMGLLPRILVKAVVHAFAVGVALGAVPLQAATYTITYAHFTDPTFTGTVTVPDALVGAGHANGFIPSAQITSFSTTVNSTTFTLPGDEISLSGDDRGGLWLGPDGQPLGFGPETYSGGYYILDLATGYDGNRPWLIMNKEGRWDYRNPWDPVSHNIINGRYSFFKTPDPPMEYPVTFSLFIPANNLTGGPSEQCFLKGSTIPRQEYYRGDDRGFSLSGKRSRGKQNFTLVPNLTADLNGIKDGSLKTIVGQTRGYAKDALKDGRITPTDDDAILHDCILLDEFATASARNMHITGQRSGSGLEIAIRGSLGNPLILSAGICCTADWDLKLLIDTSVKPVKWTLSGKHDGFPAYELYIGSKLIYSYSPGKVPYAFFGQINKLAGGLDVTVSKRTGTIE